MEGWFDEKGIIVFSETHLVKHFGFGIAKRMVMSVEEYPILYAWMGTVNSC